MIAGELISMSRHPDAEPAAKHAARRQSDNAEILRNRCLLDEDFSLERAWSEINDEPARAPASKSPGPAFSFGDTMSIHVLHRALTNFRATPQTTVEAIMVAVRARGLTALKEAANVERLVRCDQVARRQKNERITRLHEQGSRR